MAFKYDHSKTKYQNLILLLKLREGVRLSVYKDTLGKLTVGVGHLLPADTKLKLGDTVSQAQVDTWLAVDSEACTRKASRQCELLGANTDAHPELYIALASANFQLGDFRSVFSDTFKVMLTRDYAAVSARLLASKWYKQTPVRVQDLLDAYRGFCEAQ